MGIRRTRFAGCWMSVGVVGASNTWWIGRVMGLRSGRGFPGLPSLTPTWSVSSTVYIPIDPVGHLEVAVEGGVLLGFRRRLPFIFGVPSFLFLFRVAFCFSLFSLVSPDCFCSWWGFAFVSRFCSLLPLAAWSGTVFRGCCGNQPINRWRADSTHTCASFSISSTTAFKCRLFLHSSPDCLLAIRYTDGRSSCLRNTFSLLLVPPLLASCFLVPPVPGFPAFLPSFCIHSPPVPCTPAPLLIVPSLHPGSSLLVTCPPCSSPALPVPLLPLPSRFGYPFGCCFVFI
ncbi:uncharacterized protein LOC134316948 isoform X1 [Trichomycterus rosablanca]|uniref:uncharacterized protein LOC134316948 isoform X1 n=1 Tax=Trichomycterus rosablanca TaxID=2290929 RepID=UPI002F356E14